MFSNNERERWMNTVERLSAALESSKGDIARLQGKVEVLERNLAVAQNNFEWARVRLNHIEDERAALLHRVIAVSVPAPRVERSGSESMADQRQSFDELMKTISFEDIGDAEAQKLGIDHEV
jgi:hypothetical protein